MTMSEPGVYGRDMADAVQLTLMRSVGRTLSGDATNYLAEVLMSHLSRFDIEADPLSLLLEPTAQAAAVGQPFMSLPEPPPLTTVRALDIGWLNLGVFTGLLATMEPSGGTVVFGLADGAQMEVAVLSSDDVAEAVRLIACGWPPVC